MTRTSLRCSFRVTAIQTAFSALLAIVALGCSEPPSAPIAPLVPPPGEAFTAVSERLDPWVARPRVIVMTDIANEPDDQMSMVRFLVYSNQFDVEGLIAGTSTWMRSRVRPDVIRHVIDAYGQVHGTLSTHAEGFPSAETLGRLVTTGPEGFGMAAVKLTGEDLSLGARQIVSAGDRADERPLWVLAWGGVNTLAEALAYVRRTRRPEALETFVAKLRVYTISDQDDAGPWLRREFPLLHYIALPSTPDGDQYAQAAWTGISGDRFYLNGDGADFTTFTTKWVDANIRAKGPLGKVYIMPCCIHEGDTPSFLGLINNGLASFMSPTYGGWGGRYVWRQYYGETRPHWTQGGDMFPGKDHSRDTVMGVDGKPHTSDQATIWRWRDAFQRDFAARMDWTVKSVAHANHNPVAIVNGQGTPAPITIDTAPNVPVALDASASRDPDGNALRYTWFFYPEAGTGIPTKPVSLGPQVQIGGGGNVESGGIPSAGADGPVRPPSRAGLGFGPEPHMLSDRVVGPRVTAVLRTPGTAHIILAVDDNGSPSLTSYRRVILRSPSPQ
jgi:hypothetical protein